MRRPLKPFVTEYKGPRRAALQFNEPSSFEAEPPAAKPTEFKPRPSQEPEDGYEAAMRAADALFAPAPHRPSPPGEMRADRDSAQPDIGERLSAEPGRGRILPVIDEVPPPEYAALEAQFAPKRRGRKPGSKNKPKAPLFEPANESIPAGVTTPARSRPVVTMRPQSVPALVKVTALSDEVPAPRSEKRVPWARDRVKPGENWKRRRLPRVCW